mmetsp:Transcript_7473/g.23947  ORF Transcript_7473/g.23947 Transcript_7473/m.23947 type:complete len:200 (-) Transcript_7473:1203-1802(-)
MARRATTRSATISSTGRPPLQTGPLPRRRGSSSRCCYARTRRRGSPSSSCCSTRGSSEWTMTLGARAPPPLPRRARARCGTGSTSCNATKRCALSARTPRGYAPHASQYCCSSKRPSGPTGQTMRARGSMCAARCRLRRARGRCGGTNHCAGRCSRGSYSRRRFASSTRTARDTSLPPISTGCSGASGRAAVASSSCRA